MTVVIPIVSNEVIFVSVSFVMKMVLESSQLEFDVLLSPAQNDFYAPDRVSLIVSWKGTK